MLSWTTKKDVRILSDYKIDISSIEKCRSILARPQDFMAEMSDSAKANVVVKMLETDTNETYQSGCSAMMQNSSRSEGLLRKETQSPPRKHGWLKLSIKFANAAVTLRVKTRLLSFKTC